MTASTESFIPAAPPALARESGLPRPAPTTEQIAARALKREERLARWAAIREAGGSDKWVQQELVAKGLTQEGVDPSALKESEKTAFKEKKKAEAKERRALRRLAWEAYQATHIVHLGAGVHWDDRVDHDKLDPDQREERARHNGLPDLKDAEALAQAIALPLSKLRWFSYHRDVDTGTHYRSWEIPKRDGSRRTITAPKKELKLAQRWALRHIFERLPVHSAAHGFLPDRSIVTNARVHAGADVIVKLDIQDFFPTVTWKRVKGLLRKAGLTEQPATLLALMATEAPRDAIQFRNRTLYVAKGPRSLPQGAPTSPAITNALCLRMDKRLSGLARKLGFRYTRYADDLCFSWRAPVVADPKAPRARAPVAVLLSAAGQILVAEGFPVHPRKTRVLRAGVRQQITGLVVNAHAGKPEARVPREALRQLRAALHNREKGQPGKAGETLAQLRGLAAFVHMTDAARGRALLDRIDALEKREVKPPSP